MRKVRTRTVEEFYRVCDRCKGEKTARLPLEAPARDIAQLEFVHRSDDGRNQRGILELCGVCAYELVSEWHSEQDGA